MLLCLFCFGLLLISYVFLCACGWLFGLVFIWSCWFPVVFALWFGFDFVDLVGGLFVVVILVVLV